MSGDRDPRIEQLTRLVRTRIHVCGCGCWRWTGSFDSSGYPKMKLRQRMVYLHRYVFEQFHRPLADDETVDHLCDRHRHCLNPDHLEAVSRSENSRRANARRWHGGEVDRSRCTEPPTSTKKET